MTNTSATMERIRTALARVEDPEIHRPITELNMVSGIAIDEARQVTVEILLTVSTCPMRDRILQDVRAAVLALPDIASVTVEFGVMSGEQRAALGKQIRGDDEIPFAEPGSRTRVLCVASGKGGVGKSSVTVNLAVAMAQRGLRIGILDADIHGHSIPAMLGCTSGPTQVDRMMMPPTALGVRLMSVGMFLAGNEPVVWRGPMLHRALRQFLADVYWGELDVLLVDLPPGTGDIAISLAQLLPTAELLVVTTPQQTAARIAERAGAVAAKTGQRVIGVIENMSWYQAPSGARISLFGSGGGAMVSRGLTEILGTDCPVLGRIPFDPDVCATGDRGTPMVLAEPGSAAAKAFFALADLLTAPRESIIGKRLMVSPVEEPA
ncbi:Mrp/NBP35 family ATP-binding protein [Nocardia amamiensis]|uniref:Iron-sulfur cluster carrier protein n=1 Tax=Nocardia amamiensis TaxID=404578 RepID=A0ABS0CZG0_9NOCA|nr:Mrp/NBP35 family ATP-binding protein [Nocardia amamiensis]MBF6301781.1 Mrp/NBP35 family ATP-binding protein [Nocardia amamiensis]